MKFFDCCPCLAMLVTMQTMSCSSQSFRAAAPPVTVAVQPVEPGAPAALRDNEVTAAVEKALERDPGIDRSAIKVATTEGIVELTGTVGDLLSKRLATQVAEKVKGVRSVSDQVELSLEPRPDDEVVSDLRNAIRSNGFTDSNSIEASVNQGSATLGGTVETYEERDVAGLLAERIKGIRSVRNLIQVELSARPSDEAIRSTIESRIRLDALVNSAPVTVDVKNGTVTLRGSVGSEEERRRVNIDAWVGGVRSVDDSRVRVDHLAKQDDPMRRGVDSDVQISDAIHDAIAYDPRVSAARIRIEVAGGFATLRGQVGSPAARLIAESLARHTVGVVGVANELEVLPRVPISDTIIQKSVRAAFSDDSHLDSFDISIGADRGTVTLTGSVDTFSDRAEATDLASRIEGVLNIDNNLEVRRPNVRPDSSPSRATME